MFEVQTMNIDQLLKYGESSIQKEKDVQEYLADRDTVFRENVQELNIRYARRQSAERERRILLDMPQEDPAEKESKKKKRWKNQLTEKSRESENEYRNRIQTRAEREEKIRNSNSLDEEAEKIFTEVLTPEMFAPAYVLEHFEEVRNKLDAWQEHLRLFKEEEIGEEILAKDQKYRLEQMQEMYRQGEEAFSSALNMLGFEYERNAGGKGKLRELDEREKSGNTGSDQSPKVKNSEARKRLLELADIDERVAKRLIEEKQEEERNIFQGMRENYQTVEKYAFIQSEYLSHEYHYEALKEVKDLLEAHPKKYQENRAVLDQMYQDFFHLMEVSGKYFEPMHAMADLLFDKRSVSSSKMQKIIEQKNQFQNKKLELIRQRAESIRAVMCHLLMGETIHPAEEQVLNEYIKPQDDVYAYFYADRYREKKKLFDKLLKEMLGEEAGEYQKSEYGRFIMLMEESDEEHNRQVIDFMKKESVYQRADEKQKEMGKREIGKAAKSLTKPYLQKIKDFDMWMLENYSEDELVAHSGSLQELSGWIKQVIDIANYTDPDDKELHSIKEVFANGKKAGLALKCNLIQEYAEKARMLSMVKAYRKGTLTKDCFTREEQDQIRQSCGLQEEEEIGKGQMLAYARKRLEKIDLQRDYQIYLSDSEARSNFAEGASAEKKLPFENFTKKTNEVLQKVRGFLGLEADAAVTKSHMEEYYKKQKEQMTEEELSYLQMSYALTGSGSYKIAGDKKNLIDESIFRSYEALSAMKGISDMSEEDFTEMCRQLSAGAFERDKALPEQLQEYRKENLKGLRTYKSMLKKHYEGLEKEFQQYHHQMPSLEYIMEHFKELCLSIKCNAQVDSDLAMHSKEMFDLTNPEDARLYHLIQTYYALISQSTNLYSLAKIQKSYQVEKQEMVESIEYLERPQENLTEEEQRKRAEEAAEIEKFREIYIDFQYIEEKPKEEQFRLLLGYEEMQQYLEQHVKEKTLKSRMIARIYKWTTSRYNGINWDSLVKKNDPQADVDRFRLLYAGYKAKKRADEKGIQSLAERVSALQVTEETLSLEYILSHIDRLLEDFAVMEAYEKKQKEDPALADQLPAEIKTEWIKNRGILEKYRTYVIQFLRTHGVDAKKGEYLSEEAYQREKEILDEELAKEKEQLQGMLGGVAGYAQQIKAMTEQIMGSKKLKKKEKTAILKPLSEAEGWSADLTRYLDQPFPVSPEDFFDATVITLMSMFGYLERSLRETRSALAGIKETEEVTDLLSKLQKISFVFNGLKERIPGQAQDIRKQLLASDENAELTLGDIVSNAQEVKTFVVNGTEERFGAATSSGIKFQEGEKVFFFKGDETLHSLDVDLQECLPFLENADLEEKVKVMLERSRKNLFGAVLLINFMADPEEMWQNKIKTLEQRLGFELSGYLENADNKEKWKKFSETIFRKEMLRERLEGDLKLDMGDALTVRNFATERVAELLGLKNLIVRNREAVVIEQNGIQRKGFAMDQADGISANSLKKMADGLGYRLDFTREAQKQKWNLDVLDAICEQVDRNDDNYFYDYRRDDEAKTLIVVKVTGIDNDLAFGKGELKKINENRLLDEVKLDKALYESLRTLSPELLAANLEGVLEPQYLEALKKRYEDVRRLLFETVKTRPDFLCD